MCKIEIERESDREKRQSERGIQIALLRITYPLPTLLRVGKEI